MLSFLHINVKQPKIFDKDSKNMYIVQIYYFIF